MSQACCWCLWGCGEESCSHPAPIPPLSDNDPGFTWMLQSKVRSPAWTFLLRGRGGNAWSLSRRPGPASHSYTALAEAGQADEAVQLPAVTFSASLGDPCSTASSRSHALPRQLPEDTQGVLLPLPQEWLLADGLCVCLLSKPSSGTHFCRVGNKVGTHCARL